MKKTHFFVSENTICFPSEERHNELPVLNDSDLGHVISELEGTLPALADLSVVMDRAEGSSSRVGLHS